jgi:lipopolysaccharide transport system permease protein
MNMSQPSVTVATEPGSFAPRSPVVVIVPAGGWVGIDIRELWQYRHLFPIMLWRNVMRRYRQTLLGPLWFILGPLVRMVVFAFVLGHLAGLPSEGIPYPLFTYAALLPWELFSTGVGRSTSSLLTYIHIIAKVYFPRLILPTSEVLSGIVDFAFSFLILLAMMFGYGYGLSVRILILPLLLLVTMALSLAVGLLFAVVQVRYRDVGSFVGWLIQFWFYATPVAYSTDVLRTRLPESLLYLYRLNPMNGVVEGFRWALFGTGRPPDLSLIVASGITLLLLFFSALVFCRTEHSIVDMV